MSMDNGAMSGSFGSPDLNLDSIFNQQLRQIQNNVAQLNLNSTLALNSSYKISRTSYQPYKQYSSVEATGVAAIMYTNPISIARNQEYGGLIYGATSGQSYFFNEPFSGGASAVNPFSTYEFKSGWSVVGTYHTHGAYDSRYDNENFSGIPGDLIPDLGTGMGQYRFLGSPSGAIKMWQSG